MRVESTDVDQDIKKFHEAIECTVRVFEPIANEHQELKKAFSVYQKKTQKHIEDLKTCAKEADAESKTK